MPKVDKETTVKALELPEDLWKRVTVSVLYQPFFNICCNLLANCAKRGAIFYPISGLRTFDEQTALFQQGRTTPGKIVTNAKAGQSAHNFSIAIDCTRDADPDTKGLQPEWVVEDYRILAEEAKGLGLDSGFYWKFQDPGHVQLNLDAQGISLDILKTAYLAGGTPRVEEVLNAKKW